jgi:hypothetical protein
MIVGEVKAGPARFNAAMRDPAVLQVALRRFGCCAPEHVGDVAKQLLSRGHVVTPERHLVRLVAFGDLDPHEQRAAWTTVSMRHVVQFLQAYLRQHWEVLRHAQIRDNAFNVLALIEKWGISPSSNATSKPGDRRLHGHVRVR